MSSKDIAIVGMACVFPGAKNLSQFWSHVVSGIDCLAEVPQAPHEDEIRVSSEMKSYDPGPGSWMLNANLLDPAQCGIDIGEVGIEHPEQVLALQVIAAALNDAEIPSDDIIRERTDLIVARSIGSDSNRDEVFSSSAVIDHVATFLQQRFPDLSAGELAGLKSELNQVVSNLYANKLSSKNLDFEARQLANWLDLKGTSSTIDANSASSLLAIEQGVTRLRQNMCDAVVVLGKSGAASGAGAASVVLKRYTDAKEAGERIYALIKGIGSATKGSKSKDVTQSNAHTVLAMQ
ncbi:MAG: beta-ketoacyl synthase N-terminal-like domain-containing protein, partial [bacterium]